MLIMVWVGYTHGTDCVGKRNVLYFTNLVGLPVFTKYVCVCVCGEG